MGEDGRAGRERPAPGAGQPLAEPRTPACAHGRAQRLPRRSHPDHRRRSAGSARTAPRDDAADGRRCRRRLRHAPAPRGRVGAEAAECLAVLPVVRKAVGDLHSARHRRLPPPEPQGPRRLAHDARAAPLPPGDGELDRVPARADPLRPRAAGRGDNQVLAPQDASLRDRCGDRVLDHTAVRGLLAPAAHAAWLLRPRGARRGPLALGRGWLLADRRGDRGRCRRARDDGARSHGRVPWPAGRTGPGPAPLRHRPGDPERGAHGRGGGLPTCGADRTAMSECDRPERAALGRRAVPGLGPDIVIPLAYYVATSAIVLLGIWLGTEFFRVRRGVGDRFSYHGETYANWDGQWYKAIVQDGYSYAPTRRSNVAFFPAYPLFARVCARLTGLRAEQALLVVSNLFLILAFLLFYQYARDRILDGPPDYPHYVLLGFGLVPVTFFFRTAYSESLFIFASLLVLRAMAQRRDPLLVAALVGFATATRPVGVALIPPLLLYAWDYSAGTAKRLGRMVIALPISAWCLADYMLYLGTSFGDPLAFSHTQTYWAARRAGSAAEKFLALVTLEPFRTLFDPSSPGYWRTYDQNILRIV